ncbi:MAG: response regulator transcription factor [Geobacter sp.]|nr:response regulator transcription factor [Geobacter sp.]
MRILIVDDHAIVRRGLAQILLDAFDGLSRHEEAKDGQEAYAKVVDHDFDLVLMDISLPGRNGLEVLKQLKQIKPQLPVLMLSMHPEEQYAVRALKAGAAGYLTKGSAPDELVAAVRRVLQGGKYVSPTLSELLVSELANGMQCKERHESLSDREFQVGCRIASGKTITEIATDLVLSAKTVSTYRTRILEKMQMKSNAEITTYFIRNGLVD